MIKEKESQEVLNELSDRMTKTVQELMKDKDLQRLLNLHDRLESEPDERILMLENVSVGILNLLKDKKIMTDEEEFKILFAAQVRVNLFKERKKK